MCVDSQASNQEEKNESFTLSLTLRPQNESLNSNLHHFICTIEGILTHIYSPHQQKSVREIYHFKA